MKTLPNGLRVFNATPHKISFWRSDWQEVIHVDVDEVINATMEETPYDCIQPVDPPDWENIWLVRTTFVPFAKGREIISRAFAAGADVIIGSIIAAQAYPGDVVGMIPVPGYERVAPNEKRVLPDKFTVFPKLKD
jgi:hypothetical protein